MASAFAQGPSILAGAGLAAVESKHVSGYCGEAIASRQRASRVAGHTIEELFPRGRGSVFGVQRAV